MSETITVPRLMYEKLVSTLTVLLADGVCDEARVSLLKEATEWALKEDVPLEAEQDACSFYAGD